MPLEILGAGYGRTGTYSMRLALEKLGYPTYHMYELENNRDHDPKLWSRAYDNRGLHRDEWEQAYGKYRAAVDWPTCEFYKELYQCYPGAKVILTVRSAESWAKSITSTIFPQLRSEIKDKHVREMMEMLKHIIFNGELEKDPTLMSDTSRLCAIFNHHNAQVKRTIPADRLLVYELGSGWEPLCQFLGAEIPNEPFPHTNTTADFDDLFGLPE